VGLLTPDGGEGTCLGLDVVQDAPRVRRQVGYMTQRFSFYEDLTIFENLDFVASVYEMPDRQEAVDDVMSRMGLAAGMDRAVLEQAIASSESARSLTWHQVEPRLEDVFIHLLGQRKES
jgi:ABC-type multidrug transport system ATPase subunit